MMQIIHCWHGQFGKESADALFDAFFQKKKTYFLNILWFVLPCDVQLLYSYYHSYHD